MKARQVKVLAATLIEDYRVSMRRVYRLLQRHRSTWYYNFSRRDDRVVRQRIKEIAATRVRYGMWRIYVLLRREEFSDNHKRVYRIYKEEGLNLRSKRPRRNKPGAHRLERVEINSLDQCWSMDFVSDNLFNGQRFRCLTIVDNFSRYCYAIRVGRSIYEKITSWVREYNHFCPHSSLQEMNVSETPGSTLFSLVRNMGTLRIISFSKLKKEQLGDILLSTLKLEFS